MIYKDKKNREYYFGFGTQFDYPEWQNGFETSHQKEKVTDYRELKTNPFAPRIRRLLKEYSKDPDMAVEVGVTYHDVRVRKGKEIRPYVYGITRKLIAAGWQLGDFNKNGAVDDIWEEHLTKINGTA